LNWRAERRQTLEELTRNPSTQFDLDLRAPFLTLHQLRLVMETSGAMLNKKKRRWIAHFPEQCNTRANARVRDPIKSRFSAPASNDRFDRDKNLCHAGRMQIAGSFALAERDSPPVKNRSRSENLINLERVPLSSPRRGVIAR
jgi:hypothetical protein